MIHLGFAFFLDMLRLFLSSCLIKYALNEGIQQKKIMKELLFVSILSIPLRLLGFFFLWCFYKFHYWKRLNVTVGYKLEYQSDTKPKKDEMEMTEVSSLATKSDKLSDDLLFWHRKYKGEWIVHSLREEQEFSENDFEAS